MQESLNSTVNLNSVCQNGLVMDTKTLNHIHWAIWPLTHTGPVFISTGHHQCK